MPGVNKYFVIQSVNCRRKSRLDNEVPAGFLIIQLLQIHFTDLSVIPGSYEFKSSTPGGAYNKNYSTASTIPVRNDCQSMVPLGEHPVRTITSSFEGRMNIRWPS